MNRLLFAWFMSIGLASCNHDGRLQERPDRIPKESMAILQAVIRHDSLALSSDNPGALPILAQVEPLELLYDSIPRASRLPQFSFTDYSIGLRQLLYMKVKNRHFFTQNDSLFSNSAGIEKAEGPIRQHPFPSA